MELESISFSLSGIFYLKGVKNSLAANLLAINGETAVNIFPVTKMYFGASKT